MVHVLNKSVARHVTTIVRLIMRSVTAMEAEKGVKSRASLLRKGAKSRVKQDVTNTAVNSFLEDM
jgi:hypothetical protein